MRRAGIRVVEGSTQKSSAANSNSSCAISSGTSSTTGPGRPDFMIWKACRKTHGTCADSMTVTDHLVTGLVMAAMSTAWKYSRWSSARGA